MAEAIPNQTSTSRARIVGVVGSAWAGIMGVLPHVLHHVGPLAGVTLLAGTGGTLLFGAAAFLLTIPLLLRVHKRSSSWRAPLTLLVLFIAIWLLSTFILGPWVRDRLESKPAPTQQQQQPAGHEQHHTSTK